MAMTNAERQRRYRERPRSGHHQQVRLSMTVSETTRHQLERLASFYGMTKRSMLEVLILAADEKVLAMLVDEDAAEYLNPLRSNQGKKPF
ncbi:hypothetical protein J7438_27205 [Thalassotalea sp. G20_0]|uniref:hypothetical protein n=1 Tax=Thalassotalea sp. G20_0 TaxID=2821093 RepID=UPI001ADBC1A8|nr:hypothetical protein [Thalassotalea sp. G20_0]MBO9497742.1 hypothetical protein [Thalassotalea sp. G20_0]